MAGGERIKGERKGTISSEQLVDISASTLGSEKEQNQIISSKRKTGKDFSWIEGICASSL